ncbi:Siderophore-interacting FAD-binding domain protein [Chryseobacterium oranimense G311]|uniref:siderophore-interacting protein n=1 Tax=Chryseobacterium oranimense TaxID=421058 RepID=UPI0005337F62|nr:siderophore-interacting protein [Chryseobacterium oranimense]CEJ68609.1 Siderophore-interacting FAD-binding domain protein [Chryseobacterium oranimense G311]
MPSLPKWINDTLENVMSSKFKECTVIYTENISKDLRLIRFASDLEDVSFEPAYAIGIRVNERDYRNYSPFNFKRQEGTFDILFHLHNADSVGSRFAHHLSEGDVTKVLMPRGKRFFEPNAGIHFSIGDETSLGSSLAIKVAAEEIGGSFVCLHELEESSALKKIELYGYHASKNDIHNIIGALNDFLKEEKEAVYNNEVVFYLTGNGNTMSAVRKFLKTKGVDAKCIRSQAYWIEGKKGL